MNEVQFNKIYSRLASIEASLNLVWIYLLIIALNTCKGE